MGKSQQPDSGQTRLKHILIVEDDPILGDLLLEALQEEEAYEALHVLSGEMALNALQTDVPALLLLDYHLPGMNGLELADWLRNREEYEHIPILLMSANMPQQVNGNKHLRTLRKPFELETLLHIVAQLLV
jgi:CheY-like chemotaxis protein